MSPRLPRWGTVDRRTRNTLKAWTAERLEEKRVESLAAAASEQRSGTVTKWLVQMAAWHGNFQPLNTLARERLGIDLAPYLQPRKRSRGEYRRARPWALDRAVEDVRAIRAIWREHYGRWKRAAGDDLAVEIAAERWDVSNSDVHNALKQTSRK